MSLPKGFRDWLVNESAAWNSEGLIEKEQRERILARYPETPAETGALAFALRTLGVLLFGAAILLVISHNWAEFLREGQLTTVFAALAFLQGAGLWCFHTGRERGAIIGHLLGCIMYGAGIALIGQIYHLDAHAPDAVLAWCVFTIPFALILDATVLHLLVIALAGSWMLMEADLGWWHRRDQLHHGERLVFLLLLLPSAFAAYRRARPALTGALAWSFVFLWVLFSGHTPVHIFVLPLALAALHPTGDPRGRGFRFIGAGGVAFITLALGSLHGSMHREFGDSFLRHDHAYTLATAALAGWAIHRARARQDSHAAWMGLIALLTLALGFLGALDLRGFQQREAVWVLVTAMANVTTLLLAVALIRQGLAESRLRPYVYGAIVFLTWLFWRYADIEKELGYLGMAGIFLLLGIVLFVLAKIWRQPREAAIVEAMPEFRPAWFEGRVAALVPHRRSLLAGALALQVAVLGWMVYDHSRPLASGERYLVLCEPVDPRSLTKGDYVVLSYGFQSLSHEQYQGLLKEWRQLHPAANAEEKASDDTLRSGADQAEFIARRIFEQNVPPDTPIYFPLSKGPAGIAVFGDPTFTAPTSGAFLLTRRGHGTWGWNRTDVRAGIESFYIKEGTGAKWEKLRNQPAGEPLLPREAHRLPAGRTRDRPEGLRPGLPPGPAQRPQRRRAGLRPGMADLAGGQGDRSPDRDHGRLRRTPGRRTDRHHPGDPRREADLHDRPADLPHRRQGRPPQRDHPGARRHQPRPAAPERPALNHRATAPSKRGGPTRDRPFLFAGRGAYFAGTRSASVSGG